MVSINHFLFIISDIALEIERTFNLFMVGLFRAVQEWARGF